MNKSKASCSKHDTRQQQRKTMGTLRSLTVLPKKKACYQESLSLFFEFLQKEGLKLPTKREKTDDLVSGYLEFLWAEGEGRASASTFFWQVYRDYDPKLKHCLPRDPGVYSKLGPFMKYLAVLPLDRRGSSSNGRLVNHARNAFFWS